MPDEVIANLFAIVFLHVFPQCTVGIRVGHDGYARNGAEVSTEILYRTIDLMPHANHWTDHDSLPVRDVALERRILAFRSRRYPQAHIDYAQCVRRQR